MTIDKIYTTYNTQQVYQSKSQKTKAKEKAGNVENNSAVDQTSSSQVSLSDKAKQLQETESLLRTALDQLNDFEEIREEKLSDVRSKLDSGFYFTRQFDEVLSEKIFSEEELAETIQAKSEMKDYLHTLNNMSESDIIDEERVKMLKAKVDEGYYDDPKVLEETADKLIDILT